MSTLVTLLRKLFYNPVRHARKLAFVSVGDGSVLLPSARFDLRRGDRSFAGRVRIGIDSMIGGSLVFESDQGEVDIGDRTFINSGSRLICRDSIRIGSDVTIAWGCTIYDHNSHSLDWRARADDIAQQLADVRAGRNFIHGKHWETVKARGIVIEDKAWLGFNVTVLNGTRIGEGAIVGACSVVRDDVPPWTVVCGNPAVPVRTLRPS